MPSELALKHAVMGATNAAVTALLRPGLVVAVFVLLGLGAGMQRVLLGPNIVSGHTYTHFNNYVVFRASFAHLVQGRDLYALYPEEHWDLFKYSPTFAALMAPFAALPDKVGVVVWALLGSLALFVGLWRLPVGSERSRMAAAWFVALPMLQSLQNSQSNAHLTGLVLLGAAYLEQGHAARAALTTALGFFLKIYGASAVALAVLYPTRWKYLLHFILWMIGLGLLPLLFVSPSQLMFLYRSWADLLVWDQAASTGVSVMGWMHNWFGLDPPKTAAAAFGLAVTLLPLRQASGYVELRFRMVFLAALLIWMVIFNHKSEPNTFVIAVTGVGVWYLAGPRSWLRVTLTGLVLVFTCLSTTSIFPTIVRRELIQPYSLRVLPCIMVWVAAVIELIRLGAQGHGQERVSRGQVDGRIAQT